MWEKLKGWTLATIGILLGLFLWERRKRQETEADLLTSNSQKTDAVLGEKQKEVQKDIEEQEKQAEEEKQQKLSQEEMEKFLKGL